MFDKLKPLVQRGIDLIHPFPVQAYNRALIGTNLPSLPTFARQRTLAVLVANSVNIWDPFINYCKDNPEIINSNPLDTYVSQSLTSVLDQFKLKHDVKYTFHGGKNFVHFLLLAHVSGFAYFNKARLFHVFIHRELVYAFIQNTVLGLV
jgi:hypothetical protein